ncbi:hypothetical protein [Parasitella parasitica]|uniref:DUSP domain-containing protein n=1 Tax=Parasitella parasitica TaxID=35722 RepID=A0A0B7NG72_9FUNG|nr:hypothetical protein [Parasitella parasitica]
MRLDNRKDLFSFLGTCRGFYSLIQDDSFWRDLVKRKYRIKYNIDSKYQSWWELYISGDAGQMCCHLQDYSARSLEIKRKLLWNSIENLDRLCCRNVQFEHYALCMEPQCEFIGCGDVFFERDESYPGHSRAHHHQARHNVILKLSPLNFMELWCYSCDTPIGHYGIPLKKPVSEKYMCQKILHFMTALPDNNDLLLRQTVIERRRLIEQRLSLFQQNHDFSYLIEKKWFTRWIDFLIGKSNELPGPLDNSKLFFPDDKQKLRHDLIIGCDYELVGGSVRAYIERVYGLNEGSNIASGARDNR